MSLMSWCRFPFCDPYREDFNQTNDREKCTTNACRLFVFSNLKSRQEPFFILFWLFWPVRCIPFVASHIFLVVVWLRRSSKWWLIRIYTKNRLSLIYFWVLLNAAGRQLNAGRKQRAYADCKNSVRMRERGVSSVCVCASYAVGLPWYLAESHLNDIIT